MPIYIFEFILLSVESKSFADWLSKAHSKPNLTKRPRSGISVAIWSILSCSYWEDVAQIFEHWSLQVIFMRSPFCSNELVEHEFTSSKQDRFIVPTHIEV